MFLIKPFPTMFLVVLIAKRMNASSARFHSVWNLNTTYPYESHEGSASATGAWGTAENSGDASNTTAGRESDSGTTVSFPATLATYSVSSVLS